MLLRRGSDLGQEGFGQATQMCSTLAFHSIYREVLEGMAIPLEAAVTRRCASEGSGQSRALP